MNKNMLDFDREYTSLLQSIKEKILRVQVKAVVTVNQELLRFYWELGEMIVAKQADTAWGDGLIRKLSRDLMEEFPDMKGFSQSNTNCHLIDHKLS